MRVIPSYHYLPPNSTVSLYYLSDNTESPLIVNADIQPFVPKYSEISIEYRELASCKSRLEKGKTPYPGFPHAVILNVGSSAERYDRAKTLAYQINELPAVKPMFLFLVDKELQQTRENNVDYGLTAFLRTQTVSGFIQPQESLYGTWWLLNQRLQGAEGEERLTFDEWTEQTKLNLIRECDPGSEVPAWLMQQVRCGFPLKFGMNPASTIWAAFNQSRCNDGIGQSSLVLQEIYNNLHRNGQERK